MWDGMHSVCTILSLLLHIYSPFLQCERTYTLCAQYYTVIVVNILPPPIPFVWEGAHSVCTILYCYCCYMLIPHSFCVRARTVCVQYYYYTVIVSIPHSSCIRGPTLCVSSTITILSLLLSLIPSVWEGTHSVCLVLYCHCCYKILFPHSFCARGHTLCVSSTIPSLLLYNTLSPFLLCERAHTLCVQYYTVVVAVHLSSIPSVRESRHCVCPVQYCHCCCILIPHSFCVREHALCVSSTILSLLLSPIPFVWEGPHFVCTILFWLVDCCFTSTETVGLSGTGSQDPHLDFHRAPELWQYYTVIVAIWLYSFPHSFCVRGRAHSVYRTVLSLLLNI